MVKPGITEGSDFSTGNIAMGRAHAVVDDLSDGKQVPAARVAEARDALLGELARGRTPSHDAVRGLIVIYECSADRADAAQTVGDLYAAGSRGRAALLEIRDAGARTELTRDDLHDFASSAGRSVDERLEVVMNKLAEEAARQKRSPGGHAPEPPERPHSDAAILPGQEKSTREGRTAQRHADPPRSDDALDDLKNTNLPRERRQARALEAGRDSVSTLSRILRGKNPSERELAVSTLIHLGRTKDAARDVYQEMLRIEMDDPDVRRSAELVRSAIDPRGGGDGGDLHARERVRSASIDDGWLREALDSCNKPSILCAAAGREVLAISLGTRMLHEMRARTR